MEPSRSSCFQHQVGLCEFHAATSRIAVAAFLQHPAVAIRVREVGEAGVVPARGVEPGCETSVPGINRYLVPDLTDFDPTFEQAAPRSLKVGDDEIDVAK